MLPLHNRAIAKCAAKIHFFLYRAYILKKFFLADEDDLIPDVSIYDNCLVVNVFHFVVNVVFEIEHFVIAGEFGYSGTHRGGYNLVIIVVREVKSAIIVVVSDVVVKHDHGSPGVEQSVGDNSSEGRAADDVVSVDMAAVHSVVEIVGSSVVVNRFHTRGDVDMAVVVVVIRVYVGVVRGGTAGVRTVCTRGSGIVAAVATPSTS